MKTDITHMLSCWGNIFAQNTAPAQVAIEIGAKGPNHGAVSACATSGHAIGTAMRLLQVRRNDAGHGWLERTQRVP